MRKDVLIRRAVLGLLLCMVSLTSCGTPAGQLQTATEMYATTLNILADYRRAGALDAEDVAKIEHWRVIARASLDAWRYALQSGSNTETPAEMFNEAMRAITDVILKLEEADADQ